MSNHGQLSERLNQKIKTKRKTENQESPQFIENLKIEYQSALDTIRLDMNDQFRMLNQDLLENLQESQNGARKLIKLCKIDWMKLIAITAILCSGIFGGSYTMMQYLSNQIIRQQQEIERNQNTLAILRQQSGNIHLQRCGETRLLCAQIDENQMFQDGFRILK